MINSIGCLQEAVEAITSILGMAASEGSDAVPPNARSHTLLLAGKLIGDAQVQPSTAKQIRLFIQATMRLERL